MSETKLEKALEAVCKASNHADAPRKVSRLSQSQVVGYRDRLESPICWTCSKAQGLNTPQRPGIPSRCISAGEAFELDCGTCGKPLLQVAIEFDEPPVPAKPAAEGRAGSGVQCRECGCPYHGAIGGCPYCLCCGEDSAAPPAPPVVGAAVEPSTTSSTDAASSKRAQGPAGTRDDGRTAMATKAGSTAAPTNWRIWTGTPPGFEHPNNLVPKARCATLFGGEARFACDLKEGHAGPHEEYPKPAPPVAVGPNRCRENPGCTQHHGHGGDCTWPPGGEVNEAKSGARKL